MQITTKSLFRIVRACRRAQRLADAVAVESDGNWNVFSDLSAELADALYLMSDEHVDDIADSQTEKLLHSQMTDEEVAAAFLSA